VRGRGRLCWDTDAAGAAVAEPRGFGRVGQCPWPGALSGERGFTALNLWYVGVGVAGECPPAAMVVLFLASVAVLLQECVHS